MFLHSLLPMPATSASHLLGWNAGQIDPEGGRTGGFRDCPLLLTLVASLFTEIYPIEPRALEGAGTIGAKTAA